MKEVGLGILCWKCYDSLRLQLESYKENGLLELFEEKIIYFQEIDEEAKNIAKQYGFKATGRDDNKGIYEGFKGLANAMTKKYVLLLENDLPIITDQQHSKKQIDDAINMLETNKAKVIYCNTINRNELSDEKSQSIKKLEKYIDKTNIPKEKKIKYKKELKNIKELKHALYHICFPNENANPITKILGKIIRTLKPFRTHKLIGHSPYIIKQPEQKFKEIKKDKNTGFYLISSKYRIWSNQPFIIENEFYKNTILKKVELSPVKRKNIKGGKNIESQINGKIWEKNGFWWRKQNYTIAIMNPGLFVHHKVEYRGY